MSNLRVKSLPSLPPPPPPKPGLDTVIDRSANINLISPGLRAVVRARGDTGGGGGGRGGEGDLFSEVCQVLIGDVAICVW